MNDDRLRQAYDALLGERTRRPNESDVSLETMCDVLARRGSEESRLATIDRIMGHQALAEEFDILRAAHEASQGTTRRMLSAWPLGIAAALIAAVGLGTWWTSAADESTDPVRGSRVEMTLVAPAESALADSARSFLWVGNAAATQYLFELNTATGDPLFAASTADTSLALPDSVRLTAGVSYLWWVRASTSRGELASPLRRLVTFER